MFRGREGQRRDEVPAVVVRLCHPLSGHLAAAPVVIGLYPVDECGFVINAAFAAWPAPRARREEGDHIELTRVTFLSNLNFRQE